MREVAARTPPSSPAPASRLATARAGSIGVGHPHQGGPVGGLAGLRCGVARAQVPRVRSDTRATTSRGYYPHECVFNVNPSIPLTSTGPSDGRFSMSWWTVQLGPGLPSRNASSGVEVEGGHGRRHQGTAAWAAFPIALLKFWAVLRTPGHRSASGADVLGLCADLAGQRSRSSRCQRLRRPVDRHDDQITVWGSNRRRPRCMLWAMR